MCGNYLLLLLLLSMVLLVQGDIFHYYKLKKFVTAVAFARALGRRPTILPVPIPIPIPIAQNEVIRIPAKSAKTFLNLNSSPKYSGGKLTGSSSYGYALPGNFESSLGGVGGGSLGGSNIMVLDGGNNAFDGIGGSDFASSNVIRMISAGGPQRFFNKPRRYILAGGARTPRISETVEWIEPPTVVRQYARKKTSSSKKKKPIPVGEKFRLP